MFLRALGQKLTPMSRLAGMRRKRQPSSRELMGMEQREFLEFVRTTGLEARIAAALKKDEHGPS